MKLEILTNHPKTIKGKPLLFVHGMWHGAWCWEPYFLPYFEKLGYKAYALSLSNHGKSSEKKKMNLLRIKDYVNDLKQVVDSFEEIPILIGHSMGGFVVQKYLENNSVPGAVLLASVPPFGILGATLAVMKKFPGAFLKANLTLNLKYIIDSAEKFKYLVFSEQVSNKDAIKYLNLTNSESYLAYLDMLGLNLVNSKKVNTPLLIIGAEKDKVISQQSVMKTGEKYGVTPIIFDGMGHDMMLEPDYKKIIDEINKWLHSI